jgi:unsaturated rhamnogalacturonyl hydrolase
MVRRDFLLSSGLISGTLLLPILNSCRTRVNDEPETFYTGLRRKVMLAMLSMQRQNWEHGIAAQAFVEIGDEPMMILMAREAVLRQGGDGRLAVISTANGINDSATSLEAVIRSAEALNDTELKSAAERMLTYLFETAPRTAGGFIHHSYHGPELWADSIYMAPPFLAFAGYPEEAYRQAMGIIERLWISRDSLFAYRWNDETQTITHPNLWGLANAHALSGMAKLIGHLPESMAEETDKLRDQARRHLEGCMRHLNDNYLFHNIITDRSTFMETSLAMRVADTIFKGVTAGWIERDLLEFAQEIRKAVHGYVDEHGFVMGVPGPPSYSFPGRSAEGQAFFLMMEASFDRLGLEHTRQIR